jgi:hypothetical protein
VELLLYGWDDPTDGKIGAATTLTVRLVDGAAVAAYWDRGAPPMNPPTVADGLVKGFTLGTGAPAAGVPQGEPDFQERLLQQMELEAVSGRGVTVTPMPTPTSHQLRCWPTGAGTFNCNQY